MSQRNRIRCNRRLTRKVAAYVASGASLAAVKAEAAIIYSELGPSGVAFDGDLDLDLNADDRVDFHFNSSTRSSTYFCTFGMAAVGESANGFLKSEQGSYSLANGVSIDPTATQLATVLSPLVSCNSSFSGWSWKGPFVGSPGFLGLVFDIPNSGRHAGWVQVEVLVDGDPSEFPCSYGRAVVFGYAYESTPGAPILAGDMGISPNVPGDTNRDGKVDLVDLNNVRNNFGAAGEGILGDTNDDGLVDLEDLNAVRNNFGAGNAVPEPPSLVLLAAGAAGLAVLRMKRAKNQQS